MSEPLDSDEVNEALGSHPEYLSVTDEAVFDIIKATINPIPIENVKLAGRSYIQYPDSDDSDDQSSMQPGVPHKVLKQHVKEAVSTLKDCNVPDEAVFALIKAAFNHIPIEWNAQSDDDDNPDDDGDGQSDDDGDAQSDVDDNADDDSDDNDSNDNDLDDSERVEAVSNADDKDESDDGVPNQCLSDDEDGRLRNHVQEIKDRQRNDQEVPVDPEAVKKITDTFTRIFTKTSWVTKVPPEVLRQAVKEALGSHPEYLSVTDEAVFDIIKATINPIPVENVKLAGRFYQPGGNFALFIRKKLTEILGRRPNEYTEQVIKPDDPYVQEGMDIFDQHSQEQNQSKNKRPASQPEYTTGRHGKKAKSSRFANPPSEPVKNCDARLGKESAWISWTLKNPDACPPLENIIVNFKPILKTDPVIGIRIFASIYDEHINCISVLNMTFNSVELDIDTFLWDRANDKVFKLNGSWINLQPNCSKKIASLPSDLDACDGIDLRFHFKPKQM